MKKYLIFIVVILTHQQLTWAQDITTNYDHILDKAENLIGNPVSKAILQFEIPKEGIRVINEPPCVNRGISYKYKNGDVIYVYIPKGSIKFDPKHCFAKIEDIVQIDVSGVAYLHEGVWHTYGNVISP